MFTDLGHLIESVQNNYNRICNLWDIKQYNINLKKWQVINIREENEILNSILKYRALINDEMINILFSLNDINYTNSSVTSRVKAQNSIEFKIENYIEYHEGGKIPIKKCINDLFGIRIVIESQFSYDDVKKYMEINFPGYKCIDSSKNSYIATHIYFEKGNYYFPWELQVWMKAHEADNYNSHKIYKQAYTKWESGNEGGVEDGETFYNPE